MKDVADLGDEREKGSRGQRDAIGHLREQHQQCWRPGGFVQSPHWARLDPTNKYKHVAASTLGSLKSDQDSDLALERGVATHHRIGDAEVEGSLPLGRLQQDAEGGLGEAELRRAAGGQQQGGSERRSLCGRVHTALHIPDEELQGTEQGRDIGGTRRAAVALGTLPTHGPHGEAHRGLIDASINIRLLQTVLAQAKAASATAFPLKYHHISRSERHIANIFDLIMVPLNYIPNFYKPLINGTCL